ncbi:MAG TPA: hypothetical protein PKK00_03960 [Bacteroidales bacterium]|nr:hypothetical protein [Bacteroidales bacterium]HPS16539.1 hypothetical protein [Bacteroidales bacterium]
MDGVKIIRKTYRLQFIRKIKPLFVITIILGGVLGYLFYTLTSCCPDMMTIKPDALSSIAFGAVTCGLLSSSSRKS